MELTDVARTWLFLDNILSWYGPFNKERREIFEAFHVFDHCVPASTGIGAANPHRAALLAGAWAVQPADASVALHPVESPLQCSARDYGSCFSRAVEISAPDLRRLLISGTASIAPDGATEFAGDIRRQIARTMEVVEAILASRGMGWQNASRATVYLKDAADAWAFSDCLEEQELVLPVLVTEATVCRDDLLFEIEVDALASGQNRGSQDWQI
jgi:enamine deaminase RidA (YjgF/YER057c/UK114 family)